MGGAGVRAAWTATRVGFPLSLSLSHKGRGDAVGRSCPGDGSRGSAGDWSRVGLPLSLSLSHRGRGDAVRTARLGHDGVPNTARGRRSDAMMSTSSPLPLWERDWERGGGADASRSRAVRSTADAGRQPT
ncbi:hypothetical protein GCM10007904_24210 [Oharaeibacter diazotrophicus]|nr:hypothetical protein GCM10007904_24210 [Oharaeibacter diazotrophicus]